MWHDSEIRATLENVRILANPATRILQGRRTGTARPPVVQKMPVTVHCLYTRHAISSIARVFDSDVTYLMKTLYD